MTPGPFEQVYAELRKIAAGKLARESPGHTLDATALVHEAWLKLAGASVAWPDRTHFLRVAATAMRRILVDHARAKAAEKRGGGGGPRTSGRPRGPRPRRATARPRRGADETRGQ